MIGRVAPSRLAVFCQLVLVRSVLVNCPRYVPSGQLRPNATYYMGGPSRRKVTGAHRRVLGLSASFAAQRITPLSLRLSSRLNKYQPAWFSREDNINRQWRNLPGASGLASDNSLLSERGRTQAKECAARFRKTNFSHVFASPYDRTIETASIIVAGKNLTVKPEPGLCEVLYLCEKPPGFWDAEKLKEKFPLVDTDYVPVFSKHTLPKEGFGDDACIPRVRSTLNRLTEKYDGDLLIVSHGAPIGAIHEIWNDDFTYVGQGTVSKFVEIEKGKFRMEFSSDASHLSDKKNLRPW